MESGFPKWTGVSCDSRTVKEGDLFVAIDGVKQDGNRFVFDAVKKGAAAVATSCDIPDLKVPVIKVENPRDFLGHAASEINGNPSRDLKVFGITGTNGKTTTSWILSKMLGSAGLVTTVETFTGKRRFPSSHTTPDAVTLQSLFAEMRDAGLASCVMEVSSHAISQYRTSGTKFAGCAFTNLSEDHLDYHHSMVDYFETKLKLFCRLAKENPMARAVVCTTNPYVEEMLSRIAELPLEIVTCAIGKDADFRAEIKSITPDFSEFKIIVRGKETPYIKCHLTGRYNVDNILVAAALADSAGVSIEKITEIIQSLYPQWGRLEKIPSKAKSSVFVDFAHCDDALSKVLSTVREFTTGKVWAVFGAGGDRDRAKRALMGAAAVQNADKVIITSDNPRTEDPLDIIADIVEGIPAGSDVKVEPDRAKAIRLALDNAEENDSVVVCGKGHETSQEINGIFYPFDDREEIRKYEP